MSSGDRFMIDLPQQKCTMGCSICQKKMVEYSSTQIQIANAIEHE
jgi:hypothetical protein